MRVGDSIQEINLEKALEKTEIKSIQGSDKLYIEVTVSGRSKKLSIFTDTPKRQNIEEEGMNEDDFKKAIYLTRLMKKLIGQHLAISLSISGLGLSFIDESP